LFSPLTLSLLSLLSHFAADVKRAEELERRIRFLESQLAARSFRLNRGESLDVEMNELTTLELLEARVIDRLFSSFF
jgi:cell shape-determining protein MreC